MKMNVSLEALPHRAGFKRSRRTSNRIAEHGPNFRVLKSGNCQALGDQLCWLVRAEDGWLGWLPRDEFKFYMPTF